MDAIVLKGAQVVNEGSIQALDVRIEGPYIEAVGKNLDTSGAEVWPAQGLHLVPGVIDDQVHFREPGLTHKGDIHTESRAAAAGGVTSYMEMPNVQPPTLTQELLEAKYRLGAQKSLVNYSFYIGVSNDNLDEVMKTPFDRVAGVKIFMGSSTGNMLVDDHAVLDRLFRHVPGLIATHCEDEQTIRKNMEAARARYGEEVPMHEHPNIRSAEACYLSSSFAVQLARQHNTRLHVLHISTARETELFDNTLPLEQKRITAEACTHHLWFADADYATLGSRIKWNPAVKTAADRAGIWAALLDDRIDVMATDHAPHTLDEKTAPYFKAPSGGPLVQHCLLAGLHFVQQGRISLPRLIHKMCHAPALCYRLEKRGFIRPGYYADLVLLDLNRPETVTPQSLLYKCGWSPFEGHTFSGSVHTTFVNGTPVYHNGQVQESQAAQRLTFRA
jgi:dihydroorotase